MAKLSIVLPCRNEGSNLERLISRMLESVDNFKLEITIVDDQSTDGTSEIVNSLTTRYPNVKIQYKLNTSRLGIFESWKVGADASSGSLVVLMDADLQNPPEAINSIAKSINETGADLVQGIRRTIDPDRYDTTKLARRKNFLIKFCFGLRCQDATSGFVIGTPIAVQSILSHRPKLFMRQSFLPVFAKLDGLEVREVETLFDKREGLKREKIRFLHNKTEILKFLFDLIILRIYSFRNNKFQLAGIQSSYKSELPKLRRFLFWVYFRTSILHKWIIRGSARQKYDWLKTVEFANRSTLDSIQLRRLQELVRHAYYNVPFYKSSMDGARVLPESISSLHDLQKIPLLSKSEVRKNIHFQMFASNHDKKTMHRIKTSGSTGEPFICYADKFQLEMRMATTLRAFEMTGWRFGDKQLRLWHQTLGMTRSQVIREKIDALFMRRKFIPAFEMSSAHLKSLQEMILKTRPVLIDGYAESLNFLASMSFDYGNYSPKGLISSAQQLTNETRTRIESEFRTKVFDKYGSREFSGVAYQCAFSENHHVQDESYIVEILVEGRPALPGELGEIVITDLNNFSVPLIRYRIGDMAYAVEQTECECGRSHSVIGNIAGRTQALIACANGVWLPGTFFAHFFKDFDWCIKHYQVYQEQIGEFFLRIVPNGLLSIETQEKLVELLLEYTGQDSKIVVQIVDSIPLLETGKRTPVISNVRMDFQSLNSKDVQGTSN